VGFWNKIFGNNEEPLLEEPIDMSGIYADVHSHLIPGIDDGAQTMEDSLRLIREIKSMGYKKIFTTPHIMSDFYRNTPENILGGLEKVREALKQNHINIEIEAAAEYYLDFDFERKIEEEKLLTFGDNYVLFELPFINPPDILDQVVFKLKTNGYKPVLAHIERYNYWHGNFDVFQRLKDEMGVYFQINISSLTGMYSPATKKMAEDCIERGWINFIGTDCHHDRHIEFTKKALKYPSLKKVIETNPLLNNKL
jgi:tyrosine-protein phosphatase YwqE